MAKLLAIQYRVTELCSPADSEARRDETAYWDAVECDRAIRESERPEAREQARPDGDLAVLQQPVGACARIQRRSCVDKRGHQSLACHFQGFPGCGCKLLGTMVGIVYTRDQQHIWLRTRQWLFAASQRFRTLLVTSHPWLSRVSIMSPKGMLEIVVLQAPTQGWYGTAGSCLD